MNLMVQSITRFFLIMPLAILAGGSAFAADWRPDKRIEIVVPNAPGGGNDRIVRCRGSWQYALTNRLSYTCWSPIQ